MSNTKRLSKKTLFAYGCGDFACNLTNSFMGSYLSIFYTDVVGLAPAVVSIIMLVARIWDGVNDPMFGAIAERTNTKKGRFRPYILYSAPVVALFAVLAFTSFGTGKNAAIWAGITYILYGMSYTVINLSYGSLSTVMTKNAEDVSLLTSYRMMGTNLSSVLLSILSPMILAWFSGGSTVYSKMGYTKTIALYAILSIPMFVFVYKQCKEVVKPVAADKKIPVAVSLKSVITNKPLMLVFAMMILAMTAFFGRLGSVIYYIIYVLGRPDMIAVFMALPSVMTVVGIFITKNYVVRFGKKKMTAIGYIGAGISLLALYMVNPSNLGVIIVLHAVYGFFCFAFPIPMSMVAEAIDYQEDRTGIRSDGISYATVSLSTKFAGAFGAAGSLMIMGMYGYVANAQQSATSMHGINLAVNLVFGILYLCALIPLFFYPLNKEKNEEIKNRLEKKAAENSLQV